MRIFAVCFASWFVAQLIKVIVNSARRFRAKRRGEVAGKSAVSAMFKLGGMPSSHTAAVVSLCCCIGAKNGFDSDIFAACGVFAFIVMFDAFKVRLPASRLTDAFNRLQRKVCGPDAEDAERVEGHTVPEIAVGFLVGVLVSIFMIRVAGILG